MRWKLLRRRLSVSAPRMIVRSHLPWPLRWAVGALALGFSAALALWAFEFGKSIAGLDRRTTEELVSLRAEVGSLQKKYEDLRESSGTADSLLKAERVAQERLGQQLRALETEKQGLQSELAFFQRLLPATGSGLQLRGLQAEVPQPGKLDYRLLVVQQPQEPEFSGHYEVVLTGTLEGRAWTMALPETTRPITVKQVARVEGSIDFPANAVIKGVQVKIVDSRGSVRATQATRL